jgi:hypothetical protein
MALLVPPGAELAAISPDIVSYEPYREHGRTGWLVEVPAHVAGSLIRVGGFELVEP